MPFAQYNVKHLSGEDVVKHFFPAQAKQDNPAGGGGKKRAFTVSVGSQGEAKNLVEVEEGEAAILLLDYYYDDHASFVSEIYSQAPPILFVGKLVTLILYLFYRFSKQQKNKTQPKKKKKKKKKKKTTKKKKKKKPKSK